MPASFLRGLVGAELGLFESGVRKGGFSKGGGLVIIINNIIIIIITHIS